jgi:LysM repeat protein
MSRRDAATFLVVVCLLAAAGGCATKNDVVTTRTDLTAVRGNLEGFRTTVGRTQAGLSEDLLKIKGDISRIESRNDHFRNELAEVKRTVSVVEQQMREGLRENLRYTVDLLGEQQKGIDAALAKQAAASAARFKEVEAALAGADQRIAELSAMDLDQNRRLADTATSLNAFVAEASSEHQRLSASIGSLVESFNQMAEKMNALNKELVLLREGMKRSQTRSHTVAAGESLGTISTRYGVSVEELIKLNNLTDPDAIKVGQRIVLP